MCEACWLLEGYGVKFIMSIKAGELGDPRRNALLG
jgi:hypothetical protein